LVSDDRVDEGADWLEKRYRKNPGMVSRLIGGEFILVPIRSNVADLESVFTLSGTGVRIWELIEGQLTGRDLRDRIVEEFVVEPEQAEADLIEFLLELQEIDGIVVAEE
jgi:hypothetical protein